MQNIKHYVPLLIITLIGVLLRIFDLGHQQFIEGYDETYTVMMANLDIPTLIHNSLFVDWNPPTYYLLAKISMVVFGGAEVASRYPSVVAGILLIPAMYFVGKEWKSHETGLYCAAFTALLYSFVYFSRFARAYALSVLLFAILLYVFIKIRNSDTGNKMYLCFGIVAAAGVWTHYYFAVPAILLGIVLLVTSEKYKAFISSISFAILCSPLALVLANGKRRLIENQNIGWSIPELAWYSIADAFNWMWLGVVILMAYEFIQNKIRYSRELIAIYIITIVIGICVSGLTPIMPRYFLPAALLPIIIIGCFTDDLVPKKYWMPYIAITLLSVGMLWVQYVTFEWYFTTQQYAQLI